MNYNFDNYLNIVKLNIKNKKLHAPICTELESHLQDSADFYVEIGYDEETANKKALEDMGEPAIVGENMAKLHKLSAGQIVSEVLFVAFVAIKLMDIIWLSLAQMFCQWSYTCEIFTMLCLTFVGFALALRHKRLLPAVITLIYVFVDLLAIQSFFYVIIVQLSGQWETYISTIEYGWNDLKCFDVIIFTVSAFLAVVTVGLIVFVFMRIRQYIKTPVKNSVKFKKIFYSISISFLYLVFGVSVAFKAYLWQIDVQEKEVFDNVVEAFCDYFVEKEKIVSDDFDELLAHFDYLDFKKEYCDKEYCEPCGSGHGDYHYIACLGEKSPANPVLIIGVDENKDVRITAEYKSLFNYYSFKPFLMLKFLDAHPVWSEKKHLDEKVQTNPLYDLWGSKILDDIDLDLESAEVSKFTDLVKAYDLGFQYCYYVKNDLVEFYTSTETGGLFGLYKYQVLVENGIIIEAIIY